jgi:hypothetical protein
MGLDNMPRRYPCERLGTAVKVSLHDKDGKEILDDATGLPMKQINCEQTIANKVCPYTLAFEKSGLTGGSVTGMFGTHCWYRGKYGNYLLEALEIDDNEHNFYGDNEEGTYKSSDSCRALADLMEEQMNKMGLPIMLQNEDVTTEVKYAIWYLRWVADECGGMDAWY